MMRNAFTILLVLLFTASSLTASTFSPLDKSEVNSFDRAFIHPYNKNLDVAATVMGTGLCLAPAAIVLGGQSDWFTVGVMYAETIGTTIITKEILKNVIHRPRPYMYTDSPEWGDEAGWYDSCPSAHTAVTFAAASYTSYVFATYYPDSSWKWPLTAACYGIASAEGVMRVLSGNHFPTDVLAGAVLGTLIGFGVPFLHTLGNNVEVGVTPYALAFNIKF